MTPDEEKADEERPECPLVRDRLPALLENDLPPGETLLVRAHLDGCRGCAAALRETEQLVEDVVATGDDRGFEAARAALERALSDGNAARPSRRAPRGVLLAAAAASFALAGMVLLDPDPPTLSELRLASRELTARLDSLFPPTLSLPGLGAADDEPGEAGDER